MLECVKMMIKKPKDAFIRVEYHTIAMRSERREQAMMVREEKSSKTNFMI